MCDGIHEWGLRCRFTKITRSCWQSGRSCRRGWRTCSGRWPLEPHPHLSGAPHLPTQPHLSILQSDAAKVAVPVSPAIKAILWLTALPSDSGKGPATCSGCRLWSCLLGLGPVPSTSGWHLQPVTMCVAKWQLPLSSALFVFWTLHFPPVGFLRVAVCPVDPVTCTQAAWEKL